MRFLAYRQNGNRGLACGTSDGGFVGLDQSRANFPGPLEALVGLEGADLALAVETLLTGQPIDLNDVELLPPLDRPGKIICIGLNYAEHAEETKHDVPSYPTVFLRAATTLIGAGAPLIKPSGSMQFDYEGEFVAVIGKSGRSISVADALDHVWGYTLFNDASVRDYQKKSSQWTMGKNFDGTGAIGPFLVTTDELPSGAAGLRIQTRLNGKVVQDANTSDLIFDVAALIALLSEVMTLEVGDLIVTGTPGGVGMARQPPLWLKAGDTVEIELEGLGVLVNPVV